MIRQAALTREHAARAIVAVSRLGYDATIATAENGTLLLTIRDTTAAQLDAVLLLAKDDSRHRCLACGEPLP